MELLLLLPCILMFIVVGIMMAMNSLKFDAGKAIHMLLDDIMNNIIVPGSALSAELLRQHLMQKGFALVDGEWTKKCNWAYTLAFGRDMQLRCVARWSIIDYMQRTPLDVDLVGLGMTEDLFEDVK